MAPTVLPFPKAAQSWSASSQEMNWMRPGSVNAAVARICLHTRAHPRLCKADRHFFRKNAARERCRMRFCIDFDAGEPTKIDDDTFHPNSGPFTVTSTPRHKWYRRPNGPLHLDCLLGGGCISSRTVKAVQSSDSPLRWWGGRWQLGFSDRYESIA